MKNLTDISYPKDIVTKEYLTDNTYSPDNPPPGNPYDIDIKRISIASADWTRSPLYDTGEQGKSAYSATVLCAIPQTAKYVLDIDLEGVATTKIPKIKEAYGMIGRVFSQDANITLISYDGNPSTGMDGEAIPLKVLIIKDTDESGKSITTFTVQGLYETLEDLETAHPTGRAGNAYAVGTAESNVVYIWDVDKAEWVNIGSIQGPQGVPGADGTPGEKGETGERGPGIESESVTTIEVMTQTEYDDLAEKNATTLYLIGG